MRTIKPGKITSRPTVESKERTRLAPKSSIEIWDDYSGGKRGPRKREYQKGAEGRMVPAPKSPARQADKPAASADTVTKSLFREELPVTRSNFQTNYVDLFERLGCEFKDVSLLECALTHRSALWSKERADYERLEFLGDAVLDLAIADLLSERYKEAREGELSKMRAALVNTEALAGVARRLEIGPHIRLGRGELVSGGNERPSILADVMEAIFGAMYVDQGFEFTRTVVKSIFGDSVEQVTPSDPKTELQEALHIAGSEPPQYLLELVEGPDHAPVFVVIVSVDNEIVGRGRAATKKGAQRAAAAEALAKLIPTHPEQQLVAGQIAFAPAFMLTANNFALWQSPK